MKALLALHSAMRWLVLVSLIYTIFRAFRGWYGNRPFGKWDNRLRHSTATIAHIQLIIGIWLYFVSPVINYFLHNYKDAVHNRDVRFFGMEHSLMMLIAIIMITVGSSLAKRKKTDLEKHKTVVIWFSLALLVILASIPWPFSPFSANRPYFRGF